MLHLLCIFSLRLFSCLLACLNLALLVFVFAGLLEVCFAFVVAFFWAETAETRQNAKKHASLEAAAGQNAKNASLEAEAGRNTQQKRKHIQTKTQQKKKKKRKHMQNTCTTHVNAPGNGICSVFPDFGNDRKRLQLFFLHFCVSFFFFFAVWPASVSRLACFLHFGRPPLPGLRFLHSGRPWELDVPPFRILPGLGRFSLENAAKQNLSTPASTKNKCKVKFKQASKHETKQTANAKKTTQKKCKQQMQKTKRKINANHNSKHMPSLWPKDSSNHNLDNHPCIHLESRLLVQIPHTTYKAPRYKPLIPNLMASEVPSPRTFQPFLGLT